MAECPFCAPDPERVWLETDTGLVLWDAFPVSKGHTLVLPKQHVACLYELASHYFPFIFNPLSDAISTSPPRMVIS